MESTKNNMRTRRGRNEQQLSTQGRLLVALANPAGSVDSYIHKISYEMNLADATTIAY